MTRDQGATGMAAGDTLPVAVRFDRRQLVTRSTALSLGLIGTDTLARIGLAAQEDGASPAASPGAADDATPGIVVAANAFLDTLSDDERAAVLFDWTDTEQKQRWSNLPEGGFERAGLMWGDIAEETRDA